MNRARHILDPSESMPHHFSVLSFKDGEIIVIRLEVCLNSYLNWLILQKPLFHKVVLYFPTQRQWKKSLPFFTLLSVQRQDPKDRMNWECGLFLG